MNKPYLASISALLFAAACIVFRLWGNYVVAPLFGIAAIFMAYFGRSKGSARWQFIVFMLDATVFGYSLSPDHGYYLLAVSMFILAFMNEARFTFYESLRDTVAPWIEPVTYTIALGLYVYGNVKEGVGWEGWIYPIPILAISSFKLLGVFVEMKDYALLSKISFSSKVGNKAPDFRLPDQDGNMTSLFDYKGKHVLIIFVRGDWCPTCHIMLRTYERNKDKFAEKNIAILAIGPDNVGVNKDMVERLGVDYKILSDDKGEAAKAYGMYFAKNNPMTKYQEGVPLPASFLVDKNGIIVYASNTKKSGEILRPETIFPVVEKLQVA